MDKEAKEKGKKLLHEAQQQSRKLDLLLAQSERQAERIKELQDSKSSTSKHKPSKTQK